MNIEAAVRHHRAVQGHAAVVAARFYVEFRRRCRGLHACRRAGTRRCHPDRHHRAESRMADVAVTGGNMPVYFARPANVQNPPVILVAMEIFGLHEWVKDIARRVAHLGAFAIAPNYYFRSETGGVDLTKITDLPNCSRSSTPRPIRNCLPISTPPWPGRSRKAATPTGSASWNSAAAAAPCGTTQHTIPT